MKQFINQKDMKQTNIADVFGLIRKSGRITRRQLADKTQLSWGAVSTITAQLIEDGYVIEIKSSDGGVGRTPQVLEVNGKQHFSLGIDINSSGLRAVLVNLKNEEIACMSGNADFSSRERLLSSVCDFVERALAMAEGRHVLCIGVAMQGIVDAENGISVSLSQCRDWEDVPLADILESRFGLPVHIEHDPNCILFALQGTPRRDTALVRIDNGVGMAVMLGGKIIDKPGIFELGHIVVEPNGARCSCGRRGCLELYASKNGLERLTGCEFSVLVERAAQGEAAALEHFSDTARYLAYAVSSCAHLLSIDSVVLCGDMFERKELFFEKFLEQKKWYDPKDEIEISFADVGKAALGAAMIAARGTLKQIGSEKNQSASKMLVLGEISSSTE